MKFFVYAAVALVAAAAGFGIYRVALEPKVAATSEPQANAVAASDAPQAAETQPIPATLPDFTLADLEGAPRSILSWPGKSMIVNFWATWCAPCRREIPLLRQMQRDHAAEGFQVVGVAVDFREDVLKYAKDIGIDYPLLIGEQDGLEAVNKFGQGTLGFPFTVFTDNQQRIVAFHVGEIKKPEAEILLKAVSQVNRGELSPLDARATIAKQLEALPPEPEEHADEHSNEQ